MKYFQNVKKKKKKIRRKRFDHFRSKDLDPMSV